MLTVTLSNTNQYLLGAITLVTIERSVSLKK